MLLASLRLRRPAHSILSLVTLGLALALGVAGCGRSAAPAWQPGTYVLAGDDWHNPVLVLRPDARFTFQSEPGDDPGEIGAAGTWTATDTSLALVYDELVCCQFGDDETLTRRAGDRVVFRGEEIGLSPLDPAAEHH